jgi:hypothetical protein
MENLQPTPGDSAAVSSARSRLDELTGDSGNVVIVVRPSAPSDIKTLIENAAGAAPGRFAAVASSAVLGSREAQWFGNEATVFAVILRGSRVAGRISGGANQFVINRAVLKAEAQ